MDELDETLMPDKMLVFSRENSIFTDIRARLAVNREWFKLHVDYYDVLEKALKEFTINAYDLAIIDCEGLSLFPIEVLIRLRKACRDLPIILINRPGQEKTAVSCLRSGADYYLPKEDGWMDDLPDILDMVWNEYLTRGEFKNRYVKLDEENKKLKREKLVDDETRFYSVNHFEQLLDQELSRSTRHDIPLTCLLLDFGTTQEAVKGAQDVNLKYFYENVSLLLKALVRKSDIWARLSENRFAALLPHTSAQKAQKALERITLELGGDESKLDKLPIPVCLRSGYADFDHQKMSRQNDLLKSAEASMGNWISL